MCSTLRRRRNLPIVFGTFWAPWTRERPISQNVIASTFSNPCIVSGELLLDTGALVSLLDSAQSAHAACREFYEAWNGKVVTSEAVVTESTHLLGRVHNGREACLDFVLAGGAVMVPGSLASLSRARRLMSKYADLPMDYADATLVVLAEELSTDLVFTTDRRDFSVYRIEGDRSFAIKP